MSDIDEMQRQFEEIDKKMKNGTKIQKNFRKK